MTCAISALTGARCIRGEQRLLGEIEILVEAGCGRAESPQRLHVVVVMRDDFADTAAWRASGRARCPRCCVCSSARSRAHCEQHAGQVAARSEIRRREQQSPPARWRASKAASSSCACARRAAKMAARADSGSRRASDSTSGRMRSGASRVVDHDVDDVRERVELRHRLAGGQRHRRALRRSRCRPTPCWSCASSRAVACR